MIPAGFNSFESVLWEYQIVNRKYIDDSIALFDRRKMIQIQLI